MIECTVCSMLKVYVFLFTLAKIIIIISNERLQTLCVNLKQMQTQQAKLNIVAKQVSEANRA